MKLSGGAKLDWPLMENNIQRGDLDAVISFLKDSPRLTQSEKVMQFEKEWSNWVGTRYSVFVNSGSSANLITLSAMKELYGGGEIIVPSLTWVSDIASILQCGFKPVFVDIDPRTLGMDAAQVEKKITSQTRAVFLTHILGFNAINDRLMKTLDSKKIPLIEDACESHGARYKGKRVGSHGLISNFSFYYAHHLSTIEGGMACTNDEKIYQTLRMFRSHGLVRESNSADHRAGILSKHPDLNPEFVFAFPAYNVRSTEINAVLGLEQLKRLDSDIEKRNRNFKLFLQYLNPKYFRTDFETEGMSNYALILILKDADEKRCERVMAAMKEAGVEFRRGTSGGGNQLRQPYLKRLFGESYKEFPQTDHVHFYGFYVGNYPGLDSGKIEKLCGILNKAAE